MKQGPSGAPFRGWTDPETGRKTADAPEGWPFGTRAPAETADQDRAWARVQRESVRQLGADRRERVREAPDALM